MLQELKDRASTAQKVARLRSLVIYAKILGKAWGVDVYFDPRVPTAKTDGQSISVRPLDIGDEDDAVVLEALITHEAGVHCRFTDFESASRLITPDKPALLKKIANILEDVWGERELGKLKPGCARVINDGLNIMVKRGQYGKPPSDGHPASFLVNTLLYGLRSMKLRQDCLSDFYRQNRAMAEQCVGLGLVDRIWSTAQEVDRIRDTTSAIDLAGRLVTLLKEALNEPDEPDQPKPSGESGDPSSTPAGSDEDPHNPPQPQAKQTEQGQQEAPGSQEDPTPPQSGQPSGEDEDEGEEGGQGSDGSSDPDPEAQGDTSNGGSDGQQGDPASDQADTDQPGSGGDPSSGDQPSGGSGGNQAGEPGSQGSGQQGQSGGAPSETPGSTGPDEAQGSQGQGAGSQGAGSSEGGQPGTSSGQGNGQATAGASNGQPPASQPSKADPTASPPVGQSSNASGQTQGTSTQGDSPAGPSAEPPPGRVEHSDARHEPLTPAQRANVEKILRAIEDEAGHGDLGEALARAFSSTAQSTASSGAGSSWDIREGLPALNPGVEASIAPLIRSLTTRLGARLEDILLVETSSTSRLATSGRRMVSRLVPRIFAARDMRVFKHRDEAESLDTAATILMDVSGSMTSGLDDNVTCINAAAATNRSLGDVLDQFDIPFATYYFGERLTRVKGFEQRWRQRRDQHYAGTESATCTHQALGLVIPELAVRSEERKVLVVITDGMPSDVKRTVAALSEAKALGIEPAVFMVGNTNSRSTDLLAAFVADLQASGVAYSRATTASAIAEGVFAAVRSATAAH